MRRRNNNPNHYIIVMAVWGLGMALAVQKHNLPPSQIAQCVQ